ncbi:MAG TPA: ABC transporter permease [Candidatus Sulfopaludibacter sp.]|jgi:putative ABC transport system permease protein|nr:ABC transporter permease [Candidatus Sulfopaludibacter sp.]
MRLAAEFVQDSRYALRAMRRAPAFTAVAVLTLALGIGANTAIFSVVYGVWLAPARYAQPGQLVDLTMQQLAGRRFQGGTSPANLADWKSQTRRLYDFGAHTYARNVNATGAEGAEEVTAHKVSANLFSVLGAGPLLGHAIDAEADRATGPREALIAYGWWQRRFGSDAHVAGRQLQIDGEAYTIAGVMPRGFEFPPMGSAAYRPVIWLSLNLTADQLRARDSHSLAIVARLKAGVPIAGAQSEMNMIAARLAEAYPQDDGGWGVQVSGLTDVRQLEDVRPAMMLVMSAAFLVLLIACVNIANLLVARATGREREMAVRRALGVTSSRLARQLFTESGILALAGGMAGVLTALAVLPLLKSMLPANMPRTDQIQLNSFVLAFTAGISLFTGLVFGLLPLWRLPCTRSLAQGRAVTARNLTGKLLAVCQVALALVLLAGSGLLLESFRRVSAVDLGFRREHAITVRLALSKRAYPNAQRVAAFRAELLRRVQGLPGVQFAGTVSSLPMGMIGQGTSFEIEGRPETAREQPFASYANISTDYLQALGVTLVSGRYFNSSDGPEGQPVTIVSESLALEFWPNGGALGSRIRFDNTWFRIVGITKDVHQDSPERDAKGQIYALNSQLPIATQANAMGRFNVLVIRSQVDTAAMASAIRRVVAAIDRDQPVAEITSMDQVVDARLQSRKLDTLLMAVFAGLALALAAVGVFGVVAYGVARRTKEIGIRMALGATPTSVLAMVSLETLLVAISGVAIGLAATVMTSRLLARFLFGVRPADPLVIGTVGVLLMAVVVGSGLIPARRAMRVDPMVALREE